MSPLPDAFVTLDAAVTDREHAMGALGDVRLVCDQNDRVAFLVELFKKEHDLDAGL